MNATARFIEKDNPAMGGFNGGKPNSKPPWLFFFGWGKVENLIHKKMNKRKIYLNKEKLKQVIKEEIKLILTENKREPKAIDIDFSNVSREEAESQFVDYSVFHAVPNYSSIINRIGQDASKITEAKASKPLNQVKFEIINKYLLKEWQFTIGKPFNNIEVALVIPNIGQNLHIVENDMETMGYFNSFNKRIVINGFNYVQMQFEPRFQDNVLNDIKNMGTLYHSTLASNVNSIIENGFVPSCKNNFFRYPDRVYFIKGTASLNDIIEITVNIARASNNNPNNYCIMVVDAYSIPNDIEFFYDPNFGNGVFTETVIPPNTIKKIIPFSNICNI